MSQRPAADADKSLRFRHDGKGWEAWAERDGGIWRVTVLGDGRAPWVTYQFPAFIDRGPWGTPRSGSSGNTTGSERRRRGRRAVVRVGVSGEAETVARAVAGEAITQWQRNRRFRSSWRCPGR